MFVTWRATFVLIRDLTFGGRASWVIASISQMALQTTQAKVGSLTPDDLDRLALQYKPSWEIDVSLAMPPIAIVAAPQANGAQAKGNGTTTHAPADRADKPKAAATETAGPPRPAATAPPKAPVVAAAAASEAPAAPVESAGTEAVAASAPEKPAPAETAPDAAADAPKQDVVSPAEEPTELKESAEAAPEVAPEVPTEAAQEPAAVAAPEPTTEGSSEAPAPIVAEPAPAVDEVVVDKPAETPANDVKPAAAVAVPDAAGAEPLDEIPMQGSGSGSIMKIVFALVAVAALVFVGKSMLGGSEKDKPASTGTQSTTAPKETAEAKPEQAAPTPPETPKAVETAADTAAKAEPPKGDAAKTDTAKTETPKADTAKTETPKADTAKAETPKTETPKTPATTKATVAVNTAKPPPAPAPAPAPAPKPTGPAKTGGGIIRETPF